MTMECLGSGLTAMSMAQQQHLTDFSAAIFSASHIVVGTNGSGRDEEASDRYGKGRLTA